jgi:hypothetical protein
MSKVLTGLFIALSIAGVAGAAGAAVTTTVAAGTTATALPATLVCRVATQGETPTATAIDHTTLVCKRVNFKQMAVQMQEMFMMPVGVDWQALLLTPSDQHER